ncbi:hypothetical protein ACWC4C_41660 [Streptomyces olivaceoviridis]
MSSALRRAQGTSRKTSSMRACTTSRSSTGPFRSAHRWRRNAWARSSAPEPDDACSPPRSWRVPSTRPTKTKTTEKSSPCSRSAVSMPVSRSIAGLHTPAGSSPVAACSSRQASWRASASSACRPAAPPSSPSRRTSPTIGPPPPACPVPA